MSGREFDQDRQAHIDYIENEKLHKDIAKYLAGFRRSNIEDRTPWHGRSWSGIDSRRPSAITSKIAFALFSLGALVYTAEYLDIVRKYFIR